MKRNYLVLITSCFLFLLTFTGNSFAATNINGTVTYNGSPVCSMVLANGQYMFTCSGDGSFDLDVPLDSDGQITVYSFCSGLAPYKQVINPMEGQNIAIQLQPGGDGDDMDVSYSAAAISTTKARVSGTVTYNGSPVCAMALANGQYQFTCSGDGSFSLNVPLDNAGGIILYSFCSGLPPYKEILASAQISTSTDLDGDGYSVAAGDCDNSDSSISPGSFEVCGDGIDQDCNGSDKECPYSDTSLIGVWDLTSVNGQPIMHGVYLRWTFTATTVTVTSDMDCVEVLGYSSAGGIFTGLSVISEEGSQCGDDEDDDGELGPYSIVGNTLSVTVTDPEIEPPTAVFVFTKVL